MDTVERRKTRSSTRKSNVMSELPEAERVAVGNGNKIEPNATNELPEPAKRVAVENDNKVESKKKRKKHEAVEHNGYTWHVNKSIKGGETIYYDCAQWVHLEDLFLDR